MTETAKTFEAEHITDQLRQLSLSDMSRLSDEKKTELLTAINSKLETLKKDKRNGNIAKAGTELRQILYDVRRLDLQKLIEKSETVQEVRTQLAALESVENSLNTSDRAREAMGKMKISDDSPEGMDMEPGEIINAQKGWDISKALNGLDLSTATSEQLPALLRIIENISNTRYDLIYKEGGKIDSIAKEEGGPEKYLNIYTQFRDTFSRLRNEADTNALKTIDLRGVQDDPNIADKIAAQGLDTIKYDYQLKDGVLTRTNKTSKITDYRNDATNMWETQHERDARLAQEKMKAEEPGNIQKVIDDYHGIGDLIVASEYNLDPTYSYSRTDNSVSRTKDGKTDTWDTEGKKWVSEADQNARIAKENETREGTDEYKEKMRTIFEEMRSNPDVYSESEAGKETYEFNGQKLSLEGEEPNQYLTRVVDNKKEMWSSEPGVWEEIRDSVIKINNTELKENIWVHIDGTQYFKNGENVVRYLKGKYAIAPIEKGKIGEFTDTEYNKLPKDFLTKNLQYVAKEVEDKYGSLIDWEMSGDLPVKDLRIEDLVRGTEPGGQLTKDANARIRFLIEKFQPLIDAYPEIKKLTLREYNSFSKNPDEIATSRYTTYPGIVYAEDFGIDNGGYGYDKNDGVTIKRPKAKTEENNPDKVYVMMDGKFVTAREFITSANIVATNGKEEKLPGTEIGYKKDSRGNVELGDMKYLASADKWEKTTNNS